MTKAQQLGIIEFPYREYDSNGNLTYYENLYGFWKKYDYDSNNNHISYKEFSSRFWKKYEYDSNNNLIYKEYSDGRWEIYDYDSNNNHIYYEDSNGYGYFMYFIGNKLIKEIRKCYKEHYLNYKRNIILNNLLND